MKFPVKFWIYLRFTAAVICFAASWAASWFYPNTAVFFTTQYGSSLLEVLSGFSLGAIIAVASITLITLLLGRIYCSTLCPLGFLQEIIAVHPPKYRFNKVTGKIKYPILLLSAGLAVTGFILPLTLLMPSANFIQLVNYGFREAAFKFGLTGNSSNPALASMITVWIFFILLCILVRQKGRIYCNTLCPVGTVLGIFSRFSIFTTAIDQERCISCGACERSCPAGCIDARNKKINHADCLVCLKCLDKCKFDALHFSAARPETPVIPGRREFLVNTGALTGSLAGGLLIGKSSYPTGTIMPPGAMNIDRFTSHCLGCGLCISVCRGNVLRPASTEYGLRGFMLPHLDFDHGECRFRCKRCSEVCPCGALIPLTIQEKQQLRIGQAHYNPELCVAYVKGEDCGACAEHCPVGALTMVPYKETRIPQVNKDLCLGCGACQHICPIQPQKAIVIGGNAEQTPAIKPEKAETVKLAAEEDFPF